MRDSEVANILKEQSEEFRKLDEEHKRLKHDLSELNKKKLYSTDQEIDKKNMQKHKLMLKDRMADMIRRYKRDHG